MWGQQFVQRLNQDNTPDRHRLRGHGLRFVLGADEGDPATAAMARLHLLLRRHECEGAGAAENPIRMVHGDRLHRLARRDSSSTRRRRLVTAHLRVPHIDLQGFTRTAETCVPRNIWPRSDGRLQYNWIGAAVMPADQPGRLAMRQEGYTETHGGGQVGDGFDLHVEPNTVLAEAFSGVDVRDDLNFGDFLPAGGRAAYRYDFANGQESVTANFAGVTPIDQFQISGPKPAHGNAVAAAVGDLNRRSGP